MLEELEDKKDKVHVISSISGNSVYYIYNNIYFFIGYVLCQELPKHCAFQKLI